MSARRSRGLGVDLESLREMALELPGVEQGTSYGTLAFRVHQKLIARVHQAEDALVVRIDADTVEALVASDPSVFFVTDHYRGHPWVLVRFATVSREVLRECLEMAWRSRAGKRAIDEYEARR